MVECHAELESWITKWEWECIEEVERAPDPESQIQNEHDSSQKLWLMFQTSATSVAQLYRDRQRGSSLWVPFQNAASSVTGLYKECVEAQRRARELGIQSGYQRRTKDVLAWAKKRKRHIRREDLVAFLSGKAPPSHGWGGSPRPSLEPDSPPGVAAAPPSRLVTPPGAAGERSDGMSLEDPDDEDLETFREALAVSSPLRSGRNHGEGGGLSSFIAEEFARHAESRKRPAPGSTSPVDVVMESPTPKRPRFT